MPALLALAALLVVMYLGRDVAVSALGYKVLRRERANGTHPDIQAALDAWEVSGGFPIIVGSGLRDNEEQAALYAKGRTAPGKIVTNAATAEETAHGRGAALDLWPAPGGIALFDMNDGNTFDLYRQVGVFFKQRGFVWGGDWSSLRDYPHVEMYQWRTLPFPVPDYDVAYKAGVSV